MVIKYAEDGEKVQLKGKARDWKTIQGLDPADVILVIPPPPAAPIICHCTHADCSATPPGFTKIEELEEHYMQNHSVSASWGGGETVAAIFSHTEDATTPAWRRRVLQDTHSFVNSRIRGEKAANIAMDIVPVRRVGRFIQYIQHLLVFCHIPLELSAYHLILQLLALSLLYLITGHVSSTMAHPLAKSAWA